MKLYVLIMMVIATIALFSSTASAGKKGGHRIIVTSAGKKHCGCHVQKIPVPVPVPVPVHHHIP
jgi:hypothetical protein